MGMPNGNNPKLRYKHFVLSLYTRQPILAKIEDTHGRFRNNPRITIGEAINIQDAFAEILMVCFNNSAAVLYKVNYALCKFKIKD